MKDYRTPQEQQDFPPPIWFDGVIFSNSETVCNPYSGQEIELSPLEVAIYDLTMGAEQIASSGRVDKHTEEYLWETVRQCQAWFAENNPKAYMALID